ncbi:DUF1574 domain-containing protein [Thermoleptolyngbya sichuanensis A183]|uniref:DUF1574 domain-containing protein n=1 Tax=Thermoleptolyngbya sichuanensis A183 TaxID=2737172 RepID=A0A6M8BCX1_9CYAN|nr:DUF1574 domain-containing protein [Thermoleptolyngbya sichuanensis]QKD81123.1 DUF1574 domain-containing protein [Thermoleptolyngbya sichuanensis A183]
MSDLQQKHPPGTSPLALWFRDTTGLTEERVQFRLRGNHLHILCEAQPCPDRGAIVGRLLPALRKVDLNTLVPAGQPTIYQIYLYGRRPGQSLPDWSFSIDLHQLDYQLQQFLGEQLLAEESPESSSQRGGQLATVSAGSRSVSKVGFGGLLSGDSRSDLSGNRSVEGDAALSGSTLGLARQGHPGAIREATPAGIARYLSDHLSSFGISVRATVKPLRLAPGPDPDAAPEPPPQRLWVLCEANYSLDSSLLAEPLAQHLRDLRLEGFRDAVVRVQVAGESQPDWMLQVDLTPPDAMLREWARWGDVGSLTRLLNPVLEMLEGEVSTATLRDSTLHLFCSPLPQSSLAPHPPDRAAVKAGVGAVLQSIAPQGIHAATVYGQVLHQETPAWVEWLDLPASQQPHLADSTLTLAQRGDWGAIAFLLNRLLNPDLTQQLATGGIRVQLLPKPDGSVSSDAPTHAQRYLLHVMSDAPVCPDQRRVGTTVVRFLRDLNLPQLAGVRVYGRRAGQKWPLWSYGVDFAPRSRVVPEPAPEFAATDAYVGDLLTPGGDLILRSDADLQTVWQRWCDRLSASIRRALVKTHLFAPTEDAPADDSSEAWRSDGRSYRNGALAAVWGAAGLLLAVQADWHLARLLQQPEQTTQPDRFVAVDEVPSLALPPSRNPSATAAEAGADDGRFPPGALRKSPSPEPQTEGDRIFDLSGFTRNEEAEGESSTPNPSPSPEVQISSRSLPYTPVSATEPQTVAEVLAAGLPFPTFNSRQLDEKLMLYYERLRQTGNPPDVLIVGSSRALRGVDPVALQRELATLGYADVSVFNFGVNGATAQVVDAILRQVLKPNQLPRLILWADGARAFNSGAVDVTYNGIAVSPAYRELLAGTLARPQVLPEDFETPAEPAEPTPTLNTTLRDSYQTLDRWLSRQLGDRSAVFGQRDRLKDALQQRVRPESPSAVSAAPPPGRSPMPSRLPADSAESLVEAGRDLIDFDGFLPLALRFNPATYYQEYARVQGRYDGDYTDFRIEGVQAAAFQSVLRLASDRNIPVIFINLPLTDEYLDPVRRQHEQTFRQYLLREDLDSPSLVFRDLGEIWLDQYDYFSDPSHLNRYGAFAVSRRIAQDPMIPWSYARGK